MPEPRRIPDPGFAGDTGEADSTLAGALAAYADVPGDPARNLDVVLALQTARLVVPVVAVLGEVEVGPDGPANDKTSHMATALLTGRDGRQALLAFTSLAALAAWREGARPVPVTAALAARAALQEGAAALVIDVSGPTTYVVEGELLDGLAHGRTLTMTARGPVWVVPEPEDRAAE